MKLPSRAGSGNGEGLMSKMLQTTTPILEGFRIERYLGVVVAPDPAGR